MKQTMAIFGQLMFDFFCPVSGERYLHLKRELCQIDFLQRVNVQKKNFSSCRLTPSQRQVVSELRPT